MQEIRGKATAHPVRAVTPASQRQLAALCERIKPEQSECVQSHAALLYLTGAEHRVTRLSRNVGEVAGRPVEELLGLTAAELLDPASLSELTRCAAELCSPHMRLALPLFMHARDLGDGIVHRSGDGLCVEFELPREQSTERVPFHLIQHYLEVLAQEKTGSDRLAAETCRHLRLITGADRVYYCHFESDGHGHVPAEDRDATMTSLLDHHFPASDVPRNVRTLYLANRFRFVADIDAEPVPIIGGGAEAAPLDLTMSTWRGLAPSHLVYLRILGLRASGSFSVVRNGQLIGLFGLHFRAPRHLNFRLLATGQHFVELYVNRFQALEAEEQRAKARVRMQSFSAIAESLQADETGERGLSRDEFDRLVAVMDADDLVIASADGIVGGRLLSREARVRLVEALAPRVTNNRIFGTHRLVHDVPELAGLVEGVGGVFAFSLSDHSEYTFAWLRRDRLVTMKWSGDPDHAVVSDGSGGSGPRRSFETFLKETRGTSEAWEPWHSEFGQHMRQIGNHLRVTHLAKRMYREAEAANAMKTEFVANISHELRSPLHSILGLSDSLEQRGDALPAERRAKYLGTIQASARRLLALVNDLLDLAKLEAGRMTFEFESLDVAELVRACFEEMAQQARARGIALVVEDERSEREQKMDRKSMTQVLANLLSNAIKFSHQDGAVTVRLSDNVPGEPQHGLRIEVTDQGIGIDEKELDMVFEKFVQSSRTKTGAGGTGLGLPICREIVNAHGGTIRARTNRSGGATFLVFLPMCER